VEELRVAVVVELPMGQVVVELRLVIKLLLAYDAPLVLEADVADSKGY